MILYQFQLHFSRLTEKYPLKVFLTVQPSQVLNSGYPLNLRTLLDFLKDQGIIYGIYHRKLQKIIVQGGCKHELVASGVAPGKGEDAYFEVLTSAQDAPFQQFLALFKQNSQAVNWPQFKQNVNPANTPLIRKHSATIGAPGMSIRGELIAGEWGLDLPFPKMKNVHIQEQEEPLLVSTIEGCALIELPYYVHVQPVYILERDLDESRHFPGIVIINGSVHDYVRLTAEGDIYIFGNVDAAVVISGGNVFISKGIKGKDTAVIKSVNHICVGFAERCTLESHQSIYARSLTQSYCVALDSVEADSIVGGEIRATTSIRAKTIGSAGLSSQIFLGNNPYLMDRIALLQKEKELCEKRLSEMRTSISKFILKEKRSNEDIMLRHLRIQTPRLEFLLQKWQNQLSKLLQIKENIKQAELICLERMYAGTMISIEPFEIILENTLSKPVVYRSGRYGLVSSTYDLNTHNISGKERR